MATKVSNIFSLNDIGLKIFKDQFLNGNLEDDRIWWEDGAYAKKLNDTDTLYISDFETAKEMAKAILKSLGSNKFEDLIYDNGLWAWFTIVLRDYLFKKDNKNSWKLGEIHRWYPSDPNDWQKGQRHLVRMPVLLLKFLGDDADHLLCNPPNVLPDIREQLTSKNVLIESNFQKVARDLYLNSYTGKLKIGAGGSGPGSPRRLAKVHQQLDITWDFEELGPEKILKLLPSEFKRFIPNS
ncbi:MAG: hypothetical protein OXH65_07080 [Paracoccaceae bacterium]|nr:hypothetical protein [Paracoccaceae bacterium]MDE2674855.1 hypothetical protein [Paracoccaceae bacterium]